MTQPGAEALLEALRRDSFARLKWLVLQRLGVSPLSLRAALMSRTLTLRLACHMALDAAGAPEDGAQENPNFDMARFKALAGS